MSVLGSTFSSACDVWDCLTSISDEIGAVGEDRDYIRHGRLSRKNRTIVFLGEFCNDRGDCFDLG